MEEPRDNRSIWKRIGDTAKAVLAAPVIAVWLAGWALVNRGRNRQGRRDGRNADGE